MFESSYRIVVLRVISLGEQSAIYAAHFGLKMNGIFGYCTSHMRSLDSHIVSERQSLLMGHMGLWCVQVSMDI